MRVLVACEFSGVVRNAFLARGHDAWSCDLLDGEEPTHGRHVKGDVSPLLRDRWDLVIAHPPCTYLCLSGVRWLGEREGRWELLMEAAKFFIDCLNCNARMVCVENPIQHRYAKDLIGAIPRQVIQPWQFGHGEVKATCLWLKNLPPLKPTNVVSGRYPRVHRQGPAGGDRGRIRSITYQGIADAMADQWGRLK